MPTDDNNTANAGPNNSSDTSASNPNPIGNNAISMSEFLDFLKVSCQVNESIVDDGASKKPPTASANAIQIDYNQLSKNDLVNTLLHKNGNKLTGIEVNDPKGEKEGAEITKPISLKEKSREKSGGKKRSQNSRLQKNKVDSGGECRSQLDPALSQKLDDVIGEGILDSILPFICPINSNTMIPSGPSNYGNNVVTSRSVRNGIAYTHTRVQPQQVYDFKPPPAPATSQTTVSAVSLQGENLDACTSGVRLKSPRQNTASNGNSIINCDGNNSLAVPNRTPNRRKSVTQLSAAGNNCDADVVIHVCDEVKGVSRDFMCPQKLLVSKMGYFADVTSGSKQRLEDMDISVHCDLQIFEWLMKWVKRETMSNDECPALDASNVVPILVSASFLQMEPLLLDCLTYCHSRLNDVVKVSANLSCLNDGIITRLAAMFTNLELELVKDKKDRVAPRLWTKLIQSLSEPEPQSLRGHYASLAGLYRCTRCAKFIIPSISSYVYCVPQNMRINRWGQILSQHSRDTSWNVTNYVATLYKELRSWRKVYWKLWGHCHFLYCSVCETHFPAYQMQWCQYHPDQPQFLGPVTEGRTAGPGGRYPCCNQQVFRYETITMPSGCQYREHTVSIDSERERAIYQLSQVAAEGGCLYENPPPKSTITSHDPWWNGIAILPHRSRTGLLPTLHVDDINGKLNRTSKTNSNRQNSVVYELSSSDSDSSDEKSVTLLKRYSSSSDGAESDENSPKRSKNKKKKPRPVKTQCGRHWSGEVSARSNQDNQRDFEERAMKQVVAMVSKKTRSDVNVQYQNYQNGGSYFKLESEWRESLKHRNSTKLKNNSNANSNTGGANNNNNNSSGAINGK